MPILRELCEFSKGADARGASYLCIAIYLSIASIYDNRKNSLYSNRKLYIV